MNSNNNAPRNSNAPLTQGRLRADLADSTGDMIAQGFAVAVCPITGIRFKLQLQGMAPLPRAYEMRSPWADLKIALQCLRRDSLSAYSHEMLAGLVLALAGPTGRKILELQNMSAAECNLALQRAKHADLVHLLRVLERHDAISALEVPHLAAPALATSDGHLVREWTKLAEQALPRSAAREVMQIAEQAGIRILSKQEKNQLTLARVVSSKPALAKYEVEFANSATLAEAQAEFSAKRKDARDIWKDILATVPDLKSGLVSTMKILLVGNTLNQCNPQLRAKLVTAITQLPHSRAQALARIIKDTVNPYDPLVKDADALLEDSGLVQEPTGPKRSLAELIAAKKAEKAGIKSQLLGANASVEPKPAAAKPANNEPEDF